MTEYPLDFAFAYGEPKARGLFRFQPEDFRVEEELGFAPGGEGEHVYLHVRKRNQNTQWLAGQIARYCTVQDLDVGYCGLKDRHAVTSQWFSVYLPKGPIVDWKQFKVDGVEILSSSRHSHKLKPGAHQANHFTIRLRDLQDDVELDSRLRKVVQGLPNYFGEQRFGINSGNLPQAHSLLVERKAIRNRKQRGLMISAARSYLFNRVLSDRVLQGNWQQCLPGDQGDGPTGPLWGRGRPNVSDETALRESNSLEPWRHWCGGLEHVGLQQERRPLICRPRDFVASRENGDLLLGFGLGPGQYATSVLREIAQLQFPVQRVQ